MVGQGRELLRRQYAAVGAAATSTLGAASEMATAVAGRLGSVAEELVDRIASRADAASRFIDAYRRYCWEVSGPEYTDAANLVRLRQRGLGHKRSLALREFALGIEGLDRFVAGEPLYRVHECAFAVLALESDPVDPRL